MAELAPEVIAELQSMLRAQATGSFTLHIDRGVIKAWEAKRTGRLDQARLTALHKERA